MQRKKMLMLSIFLLLGLILFATPLKRIFTGSLKTAASPGTEQGLLARPELVPVGKGDGLFDLSLLDNGKVLAVGYDGHDPNRLYVCKDGHTWISQTLSAGGSIMYAISFVNGSGWIVGSSGLVLLSSDGGDTWGKLRPPTSHELSRVKFVSTRVGYAASRVERGCEIFRTTDAGRSWQKTYEDPDDGHLFDLATLDENIVIAAINNGHLIRTEDGGKKWHAVESNLEGAASVTFTRNGTGWVVGRKGSFYLSIDQGRTWQRPRDLPQSLLSHDWNSIAFADDAKQGVAVGENGAMAATSDGGTNWLEVRTDIKERLKTVRINGQRVIVLGSDNIYKIIFPPA
jgi:photosystem II stability/assembly factor-like uncharacterized protein